LEFGVESGTIGVGGIVSLRTVADRVNERGIGLVVELSSPGHQIIPEVEVLQRVEVGGDVRGNSHNVFNIKACLNSGAGWVVLSNDLSNRHEGGEGDISVPELLQVSRRIILGLEFGHGVHVSRVGSDEGAGDVVSGTDDGGGDVLSGVGAGVDLDHGHGQIWESDCSGHKVDEIGDVGGQRVRSDGGVNGESRVVTVGVVGESQDLGGEWHGDALREDEVARSSDSHVRTALAFEEVHNRFHVFFRRAHQI